MRLFARKPAGGDAADAGPLTAQPAGEERRGRASVQGLRERSADDSFALASMTLSRSAPWLPCRLYVPADAPRRVITAILTDAAISGLSVIAPSDLRADDRHVAVAVQTRGGQSRLLRCAIAARICQYGGATRFDLRFPALVPDDEAFLRALITELHSDAGAGRESGAA